MKYILFIILFFPLQAFSQWEWNLRLAPSKNADSTQVLVTDKSGNFKGRGAYIQTDSFSRIMKKFLPNTWVKTGTVSSYPTQADSAFRTGYTLLSGLHGGLQTKIEFLKEGYMQFTNTDLVTGRYIYKVRPQQQTQGNVNFSLAVAASPNTFGTRWNDVVTWGFNAGPNGREDNLKTALFFSWESHYKPTNNNAYHELHLVMVDSTNTTYRPWTWFLDKKTTDTWAAAYLVNTFDIRKPTTGAGGTFARFQRGDDNTTSFRLLQAGGAEGIEFYMDALNNSLQISPYGGMPASAQIYFSGFDYTNVNKLVLNNNGVDAPTSILGKAGNNIVNTVGVGYGVSLTSGVLRADTTNLATQYDIDHGRLPGLADDDHAQYALLAGRAAGQTLNGGNAANDDLTLNGTSHATKTTSYVNLQTDGGNVGIGTTTPTGGKLVVSGATANTGVLQLVNTSIAANNDWRVSIGDAGNFEGYLKFGLGAFANNWHMALVPGGGASFLSGIAAPSYNSSITGVGDAPILGWTNTGGNFNGYASVGARHGNPGTGGSDTRIYMGTSAASKVDIRDWAEAVKLTVLQSGNVGIATTAPDKTLEVNLGTTNAFRLSYNDADGTAATYKDETLSSTGQTTLNGVGTDAAFIFSDKFANTATSLTLAAAATTFALTSNVMTITGDAGGNTLATITGGISGQILTLIFANAVTITDTGTGAANTVNLSAAFTSTADDVVTLVFNGTSWREVSRSIN